MTEVNREAIQDKDGERPGTDGAGTATSGVNREAVREWVTALRSGVYTQGYGSLHRIVETPEGSENQFCCLGVACDLFKDRAGVETSTEPDFGDGLVRYDLAGAFLPGKLVKFLGLDDDIPFVQALGRPESVAYLNDELDWSFNQIADAIERTYLGKGE